MAFQSAYLLERVDDSSVKMDPAKFL